MNFFGTSFANYRYDFIVNLAQGVNIKGSDFIKIHHLEKIFEALHCIPELGFQETRTSAYIADLLETLGYTVQRGVGGTGIIASLQSGQPGPCLGIRADMDALPFAIDEVSQAIHACGHDAHSTMVLGAAQNIAEKGIGCGQIKFIFQPAEELGVGALAVTESGLLNDLTEIVGIHLRPIQEAKLGQASPALYHGASKKMEIRVKGLSAHGARPHLGINAIEAGVLIVNAINTLDIDPRVPHSIKVTQFNSDGTAHNIIPDTVHLVFDVRAQTNAIMSELIQRATVAIEHSAKSLGASAEVKITAGCPAAEYDDALIETAKTAIENVLGSALEPIITPGSEDFHFFNQIQDIKTAYIGLGANLEPYLHHPDMHFDKRALSYGCDILTHIITSRLG